MKLTFHHVNIATDNVERMDAFYRDVLCLDRETEGLPVLEKKRGYAGDVAFVGAPAHGAQSGGARIQTHLARKDMMAGFRTGQIVNPVDRGHIAYRTDDIEAFKRHLEEKGVAYSDWGDRAVQGWYQIFFYDPDGNVIEVHQVSGETG